MMSVNPSPRFTRSNHVDGREGDTEIGGDRSQNFTGFASSPDRSDILRRELPTGSGGREVAHVLAVVPEVKVSKVYASEVPVIAGMQNVGVSGVTVMDDPHGAGCRDVSPIYGDCAASIGSEGRLAFVGDGQRSLAENIDKTVTTDSVGGSWFAMSLYSLVVHGAVAVSAVLAVASFNRTSFHSENYTAKLGA